MSCLEDLVAATDQAHEFFVAENAESFCFRIRKQLSVSLAEAMAVEAEALAFGTAGM